MYSIFDDKDYGVAVIDKRGRTYIPLKLQKELKIKPGDQLIFFAKSGDNTISFLPAKDFQIKNQPGIIIYFQFLSFNPQIN